MDAAKRVSAESTERQHRGAPNQAALMLLLDGKPGDLQVSERGSFVKWHHCYCLPVPALASTKVEAKLGRSNKSCRRTVCWPGQVRAEQPFPMNR